jgi:hypothetical protein
MLAKMTQMLLDAWRRSDGVAITAALIASASFISTRAMTGSRRTAPRANNKPRQSPSRSDRESWITLQPPIFQISQRVGANSGARIDQAIQPLVVFSRPDRYFVRLYVIVTISASLPSLPTLYILSTTVSLSFIPVSRSSLASGRVGRVARGGLWRQRPAQHRMQRRLAERLAQGLVGPESGHDLGRVVLLPV